MNLIITFFLTSGIVINAIILLLLIKSKTKELPQRILLLFFSITLLFIIHGYAHIYKLRILFFLTFIFNDVIELLVGPIILLYIKSLFECKIRVIRKCYIYFISTFFYLLIVTIPFLISIIKKKFVFDYLVVINNNGNLFAILLMSYFIFFVLYALKLFNRYKSIVKLNFSNLSDNDFNWVKRMLVGVLLISCLDVTSTLYELVMGELDFDTRYLTLILVIVFIGYLGYYGVGQSKILLPDFLINEYVKGTVENKRNDYLSSVNDEELQSLELSLERIMSIEKKYLEEDLTLSTLADSVSISDKNLSVFLNQYLKVTFYDYVNKYRVASVKEKMKSPEYNNITLLGIAYESGFKSKTSFNRIFKKETGLSPSQYKSSIQK